MSAASITGRPAEATAPPHSATRRTFLKGVGLAGAAGLAAPLLTSTSARAATHSIVLGSLAHDWTSDVYPYPPAGYAPHWLFKVPGAFGCRSYRDTAFSDGPSCPTVFPGEQGSKPVASIRPDPRVLLDPSHPNYNDLIKALKNLIADGMSKATAAPGHPAFFAGTPQLTVWHEAGSFYGASWNDYGVVRDHPINIPVNGGPLLNPAYIMRRMHAEMQGLCNEVARDPAYAGLTRVEYGCIIYGNVANMASETNTTQNYVPESGYPMDWYGIDVYREDDTVTGSTTNTHGLLDTYDKVNDYLGSGPGGFLAMAQNRAKNLDGSPAPVRINITECNAKDNSARPQFLEWLAQWLSSNGGYRMLTFFPTDQAGPHSVTWQYVANALTGTDYTIDALNTIQNNYGGG